MIPSTTALQCFEAVARLGLVTRAAEDLNMTQSAVTRQIQKLEDYVATPLFEREGRRLTLTTAGKRYSETVSDTLVTLEQETLALITHKADERHLRLGLYPTFGTRWVMPRLSDFANQYPTLQLDITTRTTPFDFEHGEVDISVQHGLGNWDGVTSHLLLPEDVVVVGAPSLFNDTKALQAADINRFPRLTMRSRPYAWNEWRAANGLDPLTFENGPTFENFTMMIEALHVGMGIGVMPTLFVADDLESGKLSAPFGLPMRSKHAYYVSYKAGPQTPAKVQSFHNWILGQTQSE